jgi:hypothetical protein
MEWN